MPPELGHNRSISERSDFFTMAVGDINDPILIDHEVQGHRDNPIVMDMAGAGDAENPININDGNEPPPAVMLGESGFFTPVRRPTGYRRIYNTTVETPVPMDTIGEGLIEREHASRAFQVLIEYLAVNFEHLRVSIQHQHRDRAVLLLDGMEHDIRAFQMDEVVRQLFYEDETDDEEEVVDTQSV